MLNPDTIRAKTAEIKELIANGRGNKQKANVDRWLELDVQRRELQTALDALYQQKNQLAELGKQGKIEEARTQGQEIREQIKQAEEKLSGVRTEWQNILDWIPNLPLDP